MENHIEDLPCIWIYLEAVEKHVIRNIYIETIYDFVLILSFFQGIPEGNLSDES